MSFDLFNLTLEDLIDHKKRVKERIQELQEEKLGNEIKQEVAVKGFSCRPGINIYIPELGCTKLPYYLYVKDDNPTQLHTHVNLHRLPKQSSWVEYLRFQYHLKSDEEHYVIADWLWNNNEDIDLGDYIAEILVPVYHHYLTVLPENFVAINCFGEVKKGYVKDGSIYIGDILYGPNDRHNFCLLVDTHLLLQ